MTAPPVPPDAPVGVVGAGTMGAGIAEVAARAGHPVTLVDVVPGAAQAAIEKTLGRLRRDVEKDRLTQAEADEVAGLLRAGDSVEDLAGSRIAVEAVVERLEVKTDLLGRLEELLGPDAVLATNTSSLSVTAVAAGLRHPGRVVGMHFFNPAQRMRLVEVVRGDATDEAVVEATCELARAWGKTPVVCTSTPGFIVNRVARPYYGEAQRLVEERVASPATVDAVLREAGGFPMGPFELTDLVGQDVNLAVSTSVWQQTFGDQRYAPTVFQQRLVDGGRLGRKTGRGVFGYPDGKASDADPVTEPRRGAPASVELVIEGEYRGFSVMAPFLDRIAAAGVRLEEVPADEETGSDAGIRLPGGAMLLEQQGDSATGSWGEGGAVILLDWAHDPATCTRVALSPSPDTPEESLYAAVGLCQAAGAAVSLLADSPGGVVARTVAMLVNEAVELVTRGEASAEDVDVAMLLGTGYPSGPLEWGDRLGALTVATVLDRLHDAFPTGRYRAAAALARSVRAGVNLRDL